MPRRPDHSAGDADRRRRRAGRRRRQRPAQQLAAQSVDIEIAPDGQSVQGLTAQDDVQLDMPAASAGAPTRRIRSGSLDAAARPASPACAGALRRRGRVPRGAPGGEGRAGSPARRPLADARDQAAIRTRHHRSRHLHRRRVGQGRPADGQGPTMIYNVVQGTIALSGRRPAPPASCRSATKGSTSRPARSSGRSTARAWSPTKVKSVLKPGGRPGRSQGREAPGDADGDQPINVTAATMIYNQQTGHAEYTGDAQLWQGATSIRAKNITLDEATGNLTAKGTVRSVMRVETRESKPRRRRPQSGAGCAAPGATAARTAARPAHRPTAAARAAAGGAGRGRHRPAPGKPAHGGERHHRHRQRAGLRRRRAACPLHRTARMVGEQGDLRGERIELYFDESGRGWRGSKPSTRCASASSAARRRAALGQRRADDILRCR